MLRAAIKSCGCVLQARELFDPSRGLQGVQICRSIAFVSPAISWPVLNLELETVRQAFKVGMTK